MSCWSTAKFWSRMMSSSGSKLVSEVDAPAVIRAKIPLK